MVRSSPESVSPPTATATTTTTISTPIPPQHKDARRSGATSSSVVTTASSTVVNISTTSSNAKDYHDYEHHDYGADYFILEKANPNNDSHHHRGQYGLTGGCVSHSCNEGGTTVSALGDVVSEVFELINEVSFHGVIDSAAQAEQQLKYQQHQHQHQHQHHHHQQYQYQYQHQYEQLQQQGSTPPGDNTSGESYSDDDGNDNDNNNDNNSCGSGGGMGGIASWTTQDDDNEKRAKQFLGFIGAVRPRPKNGKVSVVTCKPPSALLMEPSGSTKPLALEQRQRQLPSSSSSLVDNTNNKKTKTNTNTNTNTKAKLTTATATATAATAATATATTVKPATTAIPPTLTKITTKITGRRQDSRDDDEHKKIDRYACLDSSGTDSGRGRRQDPRDDDEHKRIDRYACLDSGGSDSGRGRYQDQDDDKIILYEETVVSTMMIGVLLVMEEKIVVV